MEAVRVGGTVLGTVRLWGTHRCLQARPCPSTSQGPHVGDTGRARGQSQAVFRVQAGGKGKDLVLQAWGPEPQTAAIKEGDFIPLGFQQA